MNDKGMTPSNLLREGLNLEMTSFSTQGVVTVRCASVTERNWSRVAVGEPAAQTGEDQPLFLKQFVDRRGQQHRDQYDDELVSIERADKLFSGVTEVLKPTCFDSQRLVLGFPFLQMTTLDEILRVPGNDTQAEQGFEQVLAVTEQLLARLKAHELNDAAANARVPIFRGFDVRNIGIRGTMQSPEVGQPTYLFDLGVARDGDYQEAAARILTTIGMLNWGVPLGRFLRGPKMDWLQQAAEQLSPYLSRQATLDRLQHEFRHRLSDAQGASWLERAGKQLGIATIGRWYVSRLKAAIRGAQIPD